MPEEGQCNNCGDIRPYEELGEVVYRGGSHQRWCEPCRDSIETCQHPNGQHPFSGESSTTHDGLLVCESCRADYYRWCDTCDNLHLRNNIYDGRCVTCRGTTPRDRTDTIGAVARGWGGTAYSTKKGVFSTLLSTGLELECENGSPRKLAEGLAPNVGIQRDGSLAGGGENGAEVVTPPASGEALEKLIKETTKVARAAGYTVSKNCGLHVHVAFPQDEKLCKRLFEVTYAVEDVLLAMLPDTRLNNRYCMPIRQDYTFRSKHQPPHNFFDKWYASKERRTEKYSDTRYHGLNLHSVFHHGTVEWRYHSGTLDDEKIINWVRIVQSLVEYAMEKFDEKKVVATLNVEGSPLKRLASVASLLSWPSDLSSYVKDRIKEFGESRVLWEPRLDFEKRLGAMLGRDKKEARAAFRRELKAVLNETPNISKGLEA